jgi:hypothetical protein
MNNAILPHIPARLLPAMSFAEARISMAEARLKLELRGELLCMGAMPTEAEIDAMLAGIPRDVYYKLLVART